MRNYTQSCFVQKLTVRNEMEGENIQNIFEGRIYWYVFFLIIKFI